MSDNPNLPIAGTEWSYEQFPRVVVNECRKRGRGFQVVYAAYNGAQCDGVYKARLADFVKSAKPL